MGSVNAQLETDLAVSEKGSAIRLLDYNSTSFGERPKKLLIAVDSDGIPSVTLSESKLNLFTRKITTKSTKSTLPKLPDNFDPSFLISNETGDEVFLAEKSGRIIRYNVQDFDAPFIAEQTSITPDGVQLTSLGFLAGRRSLVAGGSDGSLNIFFLLPRAEAKTPDNRTLVKARELERQQSAITSFSPSLRGKTFATGDDKGNVWIRHGTSEKTILKFNTKEHQSPSILLAPRMNALVSILTDGTVDFWEFLIEHPETSLRTLFGKVWYEGYPEPTYTWQSTGATDEFEPKLSLVPLIFGTIKATVYSLLFAIPIALLGAVYTSEFLPRTVRGKVKPVMEVMASIPSVVLGFVAALVLAPIVESWITSVILVFAVFPVSLILSAFLWQLMPPPIAVRLQGLPKFLLIFITAAVAIYLSFMLGPSIEDIFFQGSFITWTSGSTGSPKPILFFLTLPLSAFFINWAISYRFGSELNRFILSKPMPYSALIDLSRWLTVGGLTVITSLVAAYFLELIGFDPRESFMGTYVQRNTMIVGFAMGFAVIPIIYTLAEDALNSVPEHLRSASLGCGATPWQTAAWIILPTAISGIFSAIMIGMGRAVGETMIVVMSAGNTPLIDWNIFNGLRSLSANIAVELPEAPKDGTLYRVLFLTGLVLFSMTFVINTIAELVRIHFRKKAKQL